jgi:ribosomal protein S18 acetylase RimI-like enzyme
MILISEATSKDFKIIQEIANRTWPITYGEILSSAQLNYMMKLMYSDTSLSQQINKKHLFFIVSEGILNLGFMSIEHNYLDTNTTRLHKIYMIPESQGKGIGRLLIDKVIALAIENQSDTISLNVNKFNKAFTFYQKMGFEFIDEVVIEIGNGYLMEDYRMEKKL